MKENNFETDTKYLKMIDEIENMVINFYNLSGRNDLIMQYEVKEKKIYSYLYSEFLKGLNQKSKDLLSIQYEEARKTNKIVLFIRDEENEILKSYTI